MKNDEQKQEGRRVDGFLNTGGPRESKLVGELEAVHRSML
jgi:hypothetical protein